MQIIMTKEEYDDIIKKHENEIYQLEKEIALLKKQLKERDLYARP